MNNKKWVSLILPILLGVTGSCLAYFQIDGWGWFLFASTLLFIISVGSSDGECKCGKGCSCK